MVADTVAAHRAEGKSNFLEIKKVREGWALLADGRWAFSGAPEISVILKCSKIVVCNIFFFAIRIEIP